MCELQSEALRYGAVLALLLAGACSDDLPPPEMPPHIHCLTPVAFFAPGSATLIEQTRSQFVRWIQAPPDAPCSLKTDPRLGLVVVLTGHADKSGPENTNRQLGMQRAKSVADLLVELGVAREHICMLSKGSEQPIKPANGPEGQNRRVDVSYARMSDRPQGCL